MPNLKNPVMRILTSLQLTIVCLALLMVLVTAATLAQVEVDVVLTDANTATFIFAVAPASNAYRVIITG